jgi:hypothetical protein
VISAVRRAGPSPAGHCRWSHGLADEYRRVVELARRPVSLVEIGVALAVSVAVARVLVHDLVDRGFLHVHAPFAGESPPAAVLCRLLDGLRAR